MLYMVLATAFKYMECSNNIALYVNFRMLDGVANTGLGG